MMLQPGTTGADVDRTVEDSPEERGCTICGHDAGECTCFYEDDKEKNMEENENEKRDKAIAEYVDGLRQLADWYEKHQEMPIAACPAQFIFMYKDQREAFLNCVQVMASGGKVTKRVENSGDRDGGNFVASRKFGAVELRVSISRKSICRLVTAAVYDCPDSLLEAAAEYAEVG